jgi:anti-sigma B factor antagonist
LLLPLRRHCVIVLPAMTSPLSLEKHSSSNDTLTIYQANGKLSLETVSDFVQRMRPELAQHLVIDMSGVSFLDSAGVGALVSLFVNRRNHSKTFALAALGPQAMAVVTVAGLQKLLPIHQSVEQAAAGTSAAKA